MPASRTGLNMPAGSKGLKVSFGWLMAVPFTWLSLRARLCGCGTATPHCGGTGGGRGGRAEARRPPARAGRRVAPHPLHVRAAVDVNLLPRDVIAVGDQERLGVARGDDVDR